MSFTITRDIPISAKPKIGRNDPCFCGSGKKYKKCCINKETTYVPQKGDVAKMVDWLYTQDFFKKITESLSIEIFGNDHIFDEKDMQAVTETAIYEGSVDNKTPIELFLEKASLSDEDFQKYSAWRQKNIFSIFEVIAIDFGRSLTVVDLYTNKQYLVYERLGTYGSEIGMILAARILPNDTDWVFSGGILLPLPKEFGYNIKRTGSKLTGSLSQTEVLKALFGKHREKDEIYEENLKKVDPKLRPGPSEQMLIREMMFEAQDLNIHQQKSEDIANKLFDQFAQNWLSTSQPQLENKIPKQVILKERERLGNPNKKLTYKFSITRIPGGKDNVYMQAIDLMQNKHRYIEALKLFATIPNPLENLEEPFRYLCNVGACLVYLGQMELGKKYFEKSLELKSDYELAKRNLQNHQDYQLVKKMQSQGLQKLFFESVDENFSLTDNLVQNQPFVQDCINFLDYIKKYSPEITKVRREIGYKHISKINSLFQIPDPISLEIKNAKKKVSMDYRKQVQFPKVNFLHNTCLAGGLIKQEKDGLKITKKGLDFLTLNPIEQFGIIFTTFFTKLNWQALNRIDKTREDFLKTPTEILQNISYSILKAIQKFQAKLFSAQQLVKETLSTTNEDDLGTMMLFMMIDKLLLNHLVWMGILKSDLNKLKDRPVIPILAAFNYSLTPFGNKVIEQIDHTMQNSIPKFFYQLV